MFLSSISAPKPSDRTEHFRFSGSDCLYRDVNGHRVIADWEGTGRYFVRQGGANLYKNGSLVTPEMFQGPIHDFGVFTTPYDGEFEVAITSIDSVPSDENAQLIPAGLHRGSGFVIGADSPVTVDGRHEQIIHSRLPIPFFQSVESSEQMRVILSGSGEWRLLDSFDIDDSEAKRSRNWKVQNISEVTFLQSQFEDGIELEAPVASHLNAASWSVQIPENCAGLRIRKTYDRFHGRQRARVFLDDQFTGWWYLPCQDRVRRWGVAEFGIGEEFLKPGTSQTIKIDPPAGVPLWSVSKWEVFELQLP